MNKQSKIVSLLMIGLILFFINCGNKEDDPPSYFSPLFTLTDGVSVNVSSFNSKSNKYAIISAQPTNKPEANAAPSATWAFSLSSIIASHIAPAFSMAISESKESSDSETNVYDAGQIASDEKMRKLENELLASRTPQFSKKVTGIQLAPPASPIIGTIWNNVNIVYTSNTINTTCRHVSDHAYFFIDNRNTAAMSSYLTDYGTAFDSIYDINRARFGNENDADGNGKVIIVFSQELTGGILGYFYPGDKFSTGDVSDSNEGDIFYMTCDAAYQGDIVNGTLAHEFQHMIYFDQHYNYGVINTYTWLNEALSQAAEYYNGYLTNHHGWISNYLNNGWSGLSLTHWTSSNYGFGAIYIRYLIDQYGNTAIRNMCSTVNVGINAVEAATGQNFNTIFNNFTRALVLSDETTNANPAYKFTTLDLDVVQPAGRGGLTTPILYSAGNSVSGSTYAYRIFFMQWTGNINYMNLSGTYYNGAYFGY